ncbi:MAG: AI-2E family transporter, partial [Methylococcaceae bacterium]
MPNNLQVRARFIGGLFLLLLGGWVLHSFLALLVWAVVLAVSTWPVYQRLLASNELHGKMTWVAFGLTLLLGVIVLAPVGYGLSRLLQEGQALGRLLTDAQSMGIPPPAWLENLPIIGDWSTAYWMTVLGSSDAANESLHWLGTGGAVTYTKDFAGQLVHRFFGFLTILLVLLFVYQHGDSLGRQVLASSRKLFGEKGFRYTVNATTAVRATVNGMMLIGVGKGLLLGAAYAFVGLSNPAILGALTGVFAMIPFAAKLIFGACSLVLVVQGHIAEGGGLFVYGMILTLIADNYVRPALIGGAVKLPFIWTLLGIFGGMETFGLLGLFLGP